MREVSRHQHCEGGKGGGEESTVKYCRGSRVMFTDCRARCVSVNVCVNVCSLSVEHGVCACLYLHACGTSAVLSVEHGVCVCLCADCFL